MSARRAVIIGLGNPSRGDDALGPACLRCLSGLRSVREHGAFEFIEDLQLNLEHAVDLVDRDLALFIDASVSCPAPFTFSRVLPERDASYSSHIMSPAAILYVYEQVHGKAGPPSFLLSVRGERFELGEDMSKEAEANLEAACRFAEDLCEAPRLASWERLAAEVAEPSR